MSNSVRDVLIHDGLLYLDGCLADYVIYIIHNYDMYDGHSSRAKHRLCPR